MTNTKTSDVDQTVEQILRLEAAGCEIVRVSVPDEKSASAITLIKSRVGIPVVADVHFRAELAVEAIKAGADKVRINPGNIGSSDRVRMVVEQAARSGIPIRIGVNSGSISKEAREMDAPMSKKLVKSALEYVDLVESMGFSDIVLAVKSANVVETIEAYRDLAKKTVYPLHLGVTESGTLLKGSIKSAIGIGVLLSEGIGNTVRVSLAADPVHEIQVAQDILQALGLRAFHPEVIACPTCARCEIDLIPLAERVDEALRSSSRKIKVAVMGCVVNGPGEAAEADVGLAAGKGKGVIFSRGEAVKTVVETDFFTELMTAIDDFEK